MADSPPDYDVFLCHNTEDKPVVRKLRDALQQRRIRAWFDEDQLIPGRPWLDALEHAIQSIGVAAICVGPCGLGDWQKKELPACVQRSVKEGAIVIPVLLPGVKDESVLPLFLQDLSWVDFRDDLTNEGLHRLICGIRGTIPAKTPMIVPQSSPEPTQNDPTTSDEGSPTASVIEPGDPEELLPRVVQYLHDLPENAPDLHDEIVGALRSVFPELKKQKNDDTPVDLVEVIRSQGLHLVLGRLFRWLDRKTRPAISTDGWREVLTHLVVLAAAKTWLPQGRNQRDHGGLVSVGAGGYPLHPLSAAVLVSGLFDIAVHLEGKRPTGYVELSASKGSKGYDIEDRSRELREYLHEKFQKYLKPGSPPLDDDGIRQMLRAAADQERPLFMLLPADDALAKTVSQHLDGLLTVLQEQPTAPRVLDESVGLVKYMEDLLEKLQPAQ